MSTKGRRRGKELERFAAQRFGGRRVGILGSEDVSLRAFSIECKSRQKLPATIKSWFSQASGSAGSRIPLVYLHETNRPHDEDLIIIRASDIEGWMLVKERGNSTT